MGFGATDGQQRRRGWKDEVLAMTDGLGVDVAIEAVGIPATFGMATELVRPGGDGGERRRTWRIGRAETAGPVDQRCRDHHRTGERHHHGDAAQARRPGQAHAGQVRQSPVRLRHDHGRYDTFGRAAQTRALKVAITR
jgi:alcohol dehydrogenase